MHFFICLEMFSSEHVLLTLQILHDFFCICTCLFTWQMFVVCVDCELLNSEKNIIKFDWSSSQLCSFNLYIKLNNNNNNEMNTDFPIQSNRSVQRHWVLQCTPVYSCRSRLSSPPSHWGNCANSSSLQNKVIIHNVFIHSLDEAKLCSSICQFWDCVSCFIRRVDRKHPKYTYNENTLLTASFSSLYQIYLRL